MLPNLCGTQYQQKKPAAAAAGEGEGGAAAPPSGGQQPQPQRTAALCSLPATSVVDMVRESKVRLPRGEGGGLQGGGDYRGRGTTAPGGKLQGREGGRPIRGDGEGSRGTGGSRGRGVHNSVGHCCQLQVSENNISSPIPLCLPLP